MKKETLIAILFGIGLGGALAVFILTKNKQTRLEQTKAIAPSITVTPKVMVNASENEQVLEIAQPQDGTIVHKNSVRISGKVPQGALIFIQSPVKDMLVEGEKEQYSVDFPLAFGENPIKITSYSKDGQTKIQSRDIKVYYLDEQL